MKSRYKCDRCGRHIKSGEEKWHNGRPYGVHCYEIIMKLEITYAEMQKLQTSAAPSKSSVN